MSYEPNNFDAERKVLGSILSDSNNLDLVESYITGDHFYSADHVRIYEVMSKLKLSGNEIDLFTVNDECKNQNLGDLLTYLTDLELEAKNYNSDSVARYSLAMLDKHKLREMVKSLEESLSVIKEGVGSTSDKLHHAIASVNAIDPDSNGTKLESKSMEEIAYDWIDKYEERIENPDSRGLTVGIDGLDKIIGYRGVQPGDVVVIAARPKSFKTATMTKIANHISIDLKRPVQMFSMEMENNLMFERILTQDTGITSDKFHRQLNDENNTRVFNSIAILRKTETYIDDRSNLTIKQIQREVRGRVKELGGYGKLGAIMIDYFTLMNLSENKVNPSFAYAQISKELVSLGKEVGSPIFLLAQLNRECEKRPDKRPMPSDLGDTDQLARDASLIIMLYNDSVYNEDSNMNGILELIVRANRHGNTGTAYQTTAGGRLGEISDEEMGRKLADAEYQDRKKEQSESYGGKYKR